MRIHCFSDVHLDHVSHGVPRREEILASVDVSLAGVREGDVVVFVGDLCDPGTNRSYQAISDAILIDRKAKAKGARTFWLRGNHDVLEDGSGGSVLDPLEAADARVVSEPTVIPGFLDNPDTWLVFLPHAPIAKRYDPEAFLADAMKGFVKTAKDERAHCIVFGHLNPEGITPGSEVKDMPRGREVFWPKLISKGGTRARDARILYVGGHIHRAQEYDGIHIVGSPVRFTFGESDHIPQTFVVEWKGKGWNVERKPIEKTIKLKRFFTADGARMIGEGLLGKGDFVCGISDEDLERVVKTAGAIFIPLPKVSQASPKAGVSREAKKHRRVREVVLDVARAYPSAENGLLDRVEKTMTESEL